MNSISVIIPTYNRAKTIIKSVESVLNQTYNSIEVIVVDDCSNDNTEDLVSSIDDKRVKYVKLDKNSGVANARNIGASIARNEIIAFNDSDDYWRADKLEKQMKYWESNPNDILVYCAFFKIYDNATVRIPREFESIELLRGYIYPSLLLRNVIGAPAVITTKKVMKEVKFDTALQAYEDWDWAIKVSRMGKIGYVDEELLDSYDSGVSLNSNHIKRYESRVKIIKRYFDDISKYNLMNQIVTNVMMEALSFGVYHEVKALFEKEFFND